MERRKRSIKAEIASPTSSIITTVENSNFNSILKGELRTPQSSQKASRRVSFAAELPDQGPSRSLILNDVEKAVVASSEFHQPGASSSKKRRRQEDDFLGDFQPLPDDETPKKKRFRPEVPEVCRKLLGRSAVDDYEVYLVHNPLMLALAECSDLFSSEFFTGDVSAISSTEMRLEGEDESYAVRCARSTTDNPRCTSAVFLRTGPDDLELLCAPIAGALTVSQAFKAPAVQVQPRALAVGPPPIKAELKQRFVPFGCNYRSGGRAQKKQRRKNNSSRSDK